MPRDRPHNLSCLYDWGGRAFSNRASLFSFSGLAFSGRVKSGRRSAGKLMLPIRARIAYCRNKDWRGASLDEQSTETVDHFGVSKEEIGSQCSVVPSTGSTGRDVGESWRKTMGKKQGKGSEWTEVVRFDWGVAPNGDRIIKRRFPNDVVISLSSSCPTQVKSRSARSKPISSQVCRIAGGGHISYGGEYLGTWWLRTSVTTAFVTLLGPTSWESNVGLRRPVDPIVRDYGRVISGILPFEEEDLRNSARRVNPIELEEPLEGRLGLRWQNLRKFPWGVDPNDQSNCSATWLCRRRGDNARGRRTNFSEGVCQERDGRNWLCSGRVRIFVRTGIGAGALTVGHDDGRRQGG